MYSVEVVNPRGELVGTESFTAHSDKEAVRWGKQVALRIQAESLNVGSAKGSVLDNENNQIASFALAAGGQR